jgi:predicted outer membrane repeat protein
MAILIVLMYLLPPIMPVARADGAWYVAPNGSDANDCRTPVSPCKAAGTAVASAAAGDTIFLAAGTYFEALTITKSLALVGAGAATTALDGGGVERLLTIEGPIQVSISGLSIQNGHDWATGGIYNYYGAVTLMSSIVQHNYSFVGPGGGIYNIGKFTIVNSVIENNIAELVGGGIYNAEGVMTIERSSVRNNTAAYTRTALAGSAGGGIMNNGTMTLRRTEVRGNVSYSNMNNAYGGGIYNTGMLKLSASTISANQAAGYGAGVYNDGSLTIESSTISGNTVSMYVPRAEGGFGGGISSSGNLKITNSTLSDNTAAVQGGGIWSTGAITITNATISDNSAALQGGGIAQAGGVIKLQNTIVAVNHGAGSPDCLGTLASQGYNLLGDDLGCAFTPDVGDQIGTHTGPIDPRLGPLQDNGGPTFTRQLLRDSPAIDAANPATPGSGGSTCPPIDQRGFRRPQQSACDIGAYELGRWYALPLILDAPPPSRSGMYAQKR